MNEKEYNVGYYLNMIKVMDKTKDLIKEHPLIKSEKMKWWIMELIAIYYSKPFTSSNRAYKKENRTKHQAHKILVEDLNFTEEERKVHDLAYEWRNGCIAHSDQEKRNQQVTLEVGKDGRTVGFESLSSSKIMPLFDNHLKILKINITKIKSLLWSKIYSLPIDK